MDKTDFENLAKLSALIASDKKAEDVLILDVSNLTPTAYFFTIAQANSAPQIGAVCDEIEKQFKEKGILPLRIESKSSPVWRVMDYGGLIIHIMSEQIRHTYRIEEFWKEAQTVDFMPQMQKIENQNGKIEQIESISKPPIIKKTKKSAKKTAGKTIKKNVKKPAQKTAKKTAKKNVKKIAKKTAKKNIKKNVKKSAQKTAKKTAKKGINKSGAAKKTKTAKKAKKIIKKDAKAISKKPVKKSVKKLIKKHKKLKVKS